MAAQIMSFRPIFLSLFVLMTLSTGCSSYRPIETHGKQTAKVKIYKARITLLDGSKHAGFLYRVEKNKVILSREAKEYDNLTSFEVKKISKIQLRRKSQTLRGAGIGFLVGSVIGAWLYENSGDNPGYFGALGIAFIAVPAGVLGAVFGSSEKTISIFGHLEIFEEHRVFLQSLSIASQLTPGNHVTRGLAPIPSPREGRPM